MKEIWEEDGLTSFGYALRELAESAGVKLPERYSRESAFFIQDGNKKYVFCVSAPDSEERNLIIQHLGRRCFLKSFFSTQKQDGRKAPASGRRKATPSQK